MNGSAGNPQHKDEAILTPDIHTTTSTAMQQDQTQDPTTRALRFLSAASPETLCGIAVGLAACTYLILGRFGLILIGGLGGVVLHATWDRHTAPTGSTEHLRRESSLDVVTRLLALRASPAEEADDKEDSRAMLGNGFGTQEPETAAALNELVEAVIRDYVKWWYQPILPGESSFPTAARSTLMKFFLSVSHHLSRKRPADTFLNFLTNSSSIVIVFLGELSSAISSSQGMNITPAEAVYGYLAANPDSSLANVLSERQQSKKFSMIADDILQNFLEKTSYECDPVRIFLREMLGGLVLETTLKGCSKPEWMNGWIVYLLEKGEPDISQAIDAGMGSSTVIQSSPMYDIDGNLGNIDLAQHRAESKGHRKRLSKAEVAMEEAIEEANRLSKLIAEEDAKGTHLTMSNVEPASANFTAVANGSVKTNDASPVVLTGTSSQLSNPPPNGAGEIIQRGQDMTEHHQQVSDRKATNHVSEGELSATPSALQNTASFTSFDQLIPQPVATHGDSLRNRRRQTTSLTLHNANIIIHDDASSNERGKLRSKPNTDYLVQIEPAASEHPGWMIVRKYPDFETLHEVLRRIAQISGVTAFAEQHHGLPSWKDHTKASLRGELERYLRDACWYQPLAESEGMKRFLEKDQSQSIPSSTNKNGFSGIGWPNPTAFESMGKGMLDVLSSAPKGVAESGKVIGGGLTGVFNNIGSLGQKKPQNSGGSITNGGGPSRSSISILPRMDSMNSVVTSRSARASEDSLRPAHIIHTQPSRKPSMERRPSYNSITEDQSEREPRTSSSTRSSMSGRRSTTQSRDPSRAPSVRGTPISSPMQGNMEDIKLPPPPSHIPDDYGKPTAVSASGTPGTDFNTPTMRASASTAPSPARSSFSATRTQPISPPASSKTARKGHPPLTEAETRVAVELLFAVINEMYTLSSAWNIRRTLLTAAKTFLLRPGNPSLSSIQSLIQDSVIAANISDAGVAAHLRKLRANALPTEDELKAWPAEMMTEEKERLRIKAKRLLVERGVPAALTGVMGQAATSEAMGRIFDCLQLEEVSRGLMFGLLLQGVRAVTQ